MCDANYISAKVSSSDFDQVTHEGGTLMASVTDADAFGLQEAAQWLAEACELMSGQINLSARQILAAKEDFDIIVEMRVTPRSATTSIDDAGSSQSDVDRVMSEGGTLTFHLTKGPVMGLNNATYYLGELFADRGRVFAGAIHMLRKNFDITVEVRLSAKTK